MTYDEFLDITPFELTIKVDAYIKKRDEELQKPVIEAWAIGRMVMIGIASLFNEKVNYPSLEELEPKKSEPMTPEQMEAQVVALARAFGAKEIIIDEG